MDIIRKTKREIAQLKRIQGATQVARAVVLAIKKYGESIRTEKKSEFLKKLNSASKDLLSARPTEPLAQNAVKFIFYRIKKAKDVQELKLELKKSSSEILETIEKSKATIASQVAKIIKNEDKVFTHCHSSTVEEGFKIAKKQGKHFYVFNTETRPLFQGHITAKNLIKYNIPVTMVVDSSAAFLISKHSGKELMMNKVIIGCDAILPDGSIINKIGSFGIGLASYYEKVPFYVAATLLKFHHKSWIKIERRSPKEVWKKAPKGLKIINFAFDMVPAQYIKGIVCEAGIISPSNIKREVKKIYPWLIK
ncbi:S-methyl-5-thioribose-1-phosphate isomerase [bacterium]|nr:S-methyl-5-thioribose-1-phosphate isomerase [bacterium]